MANKKPAGKELFVRNPDAVLREEGPDGALLFNPDTNQVRVINATGLFIWKHCNGEKTIPDIINALKKKYSAVPKDKVEGQVKEFIDNMRAGGFLGIPGEKKN